MFSFLSNNNEEGQGLVEYALILVLVAIVSIVALATMGKALCKPYERTVNALGGSYLCEDVSTDYSWNVDVFTPKETCDRMGAPSGIRVYVWAPKNTQTGDTFYHSTDGENPPGEDFVVTEDFLCP
jgi:pilus assembly protein Flp/PilA